MGRSEKPEITNPSCPIAVLHKKGFPWCVLGLWSVLGDFVGTRHSAEESAPELNSPHMLLKFISPFENSRLYTEPIFFFFYSRSALALRSTNMIISNL